MLTFNCCLIALPDPPDAPILKVSSTTLNSVILSWDIIDDSIPQDPMSGYIVYYKVEKGDWEEIPIYADKLRYTVKNLACGKRYQFYIIPFNSAGKFIMIIDQRKSYQHLDHI